MTNRILLGSFLALFATTVLAFSVSAVAQEERAGPRSVLDEIIVQTTKRAKAAQTVPTAVTAFSGVRLEREHAVTLEDFNHSIPNTQLEHVGLFQAAGSFSMRGIGTAGIESFADPVVAVFVDGVYYSRNAVSLLDLFDIESIEALRGPQGTVWGRNAFAGAVVVRTKRPDMDEFGATFQGDVGNAGRLNGGIIGNFPVVEGKVAIRVGANFHKLSGFFKSSGVRYELDGSGGGLLGAGLPVAIPDASLEGKRINGERSSYFRPSIRFTPNDNLDVTIIGEIWRDRGKGTGNWTQCYEPNSFPPPRGTGPSGAPDVHSLLGFPCVDPFGDKRFGIAGDGSDPFVVDFDVSPNQTNHDVWGVTLLADYTTSVGTISLTVNHRDVEEDVVSDTDGFAAEVFSSSRVQSFDSTQVELKFVSDFSDTIDVLAGVFYLEDQYAVQQFLWIFLDSNLYGGGGFSRQNPFLSWGQNGQDRRSYAFYSQIDWHFTDKLTLILGGRYSKEKKFNVFGMAINDSNCLPGTAPFAVAAADTSGTLVGAACNGVPFAGTDVTDVFDFNPAVLFGPASRSWDNFSPRVGVDFQMTEDVLLFAFWQRAYKSGGLGNNAGTETVFLAGFDPERVDNYEIGIKSDWLDNTLRINLNAFHSQYANLVRGVIRAANTSTGQETFNDNAAGARSFGVELEFSFIPTEGLTFYGVVGWLDMKYKNFCGDVNGPEFSATVPTSECGIVTLTAVADTYLVDTDQSGLDLVRAPTWDLQIGVTYEHEVGNGGLLIWNASVSHTTSMALTTPNDVGFIRDPLTTVNAVVTWEAPNGQYRISLFGRNINNDVERLGGTPVATLFAFASPTQPRQFGISATFEM